MDDADRLSRGLLVLGVRDRVHLIHDPQDHVSAPMRGVGTDERIEVVRRRDQTRERRRLRQVELARVDPEVRLGGSLDAVGALPEVHGVEVVGEDLVLRVAMFHLQGERGLVDLATEVLSIARVEVLHQLLGDRRAAFDDAAVADVDGERACQREQVEAAVVIEPAVLDRDGRVPDRQWDLIPGEDDTVLGRVQIGDERPVARVDRRRLGERTLPLVVQPGKVARAGQEGEHREQGEGAGLHHRRERTAASSRSWEADAPCARADMPIL